MSRELDLGSALLGVSAAARRALQAAIDATLEGERARARAEIDAALAHDPEVAGVRLIAAQIRYALGQHQLALDELDRVGPGDAARQADELRYTLSAQLGWNHEALAVVERRMADRGAEGRLWHGRAVRLFGSHRHPARALGHLEAVIAASTPAATLELSAAHLSAWLGDHGRARARLGRAVDLEPSSAPLRTAAAQMLAEGGYYEAAIAEADRAVALAPAPVSHATRAQLCLWAQDLPGAEAAVHRCLELDPGDAPGLRIRGAVALMRGDFDRALGDLDESTRRDPSDPEPYVWRAEALLRGGRFQECKSEISRALSRAERYLFAAHVIGLIATLRGPTGHEQRVLRGTLLGEIHAGALEVFPAAREAFESGERAPVIEALETVLARLGGNRTDRPTWLDEHARLLPLRARSGARFDSRAALELVRIAPIDEVLARLTELERVHPGSPLPPCHRGEANLWAGRYDEARRDLGRAIELSPVSRWAYIGMTAVEMLTGRADRALEVSALGVERLRSTGPAVHVHRGEAYRRLGRLEEALADLETATQMHPSRLGAWVNLALAYDALGRADDADSIHRRLRARAPGLLSDAALAAELDEADAPGARERLLESALELMRGNRASTCQTYVTHRGALRTVPQGATSDADPRQTSKWLSAASRWLAERVPSSPGSPARSRGTDPHRDVELVALRAGLRRVIRLTLNVREIAPVTERLERTGLIVRVERAPADRDGERHDLVFVARNAADAQAALDAERSADVRALGALLGFPACCVEVFARRAGYAEGVGQQYEGAVAGWVPRPSPRLNNLLFGLGVRFISFEPCRYDCPSAVETADAIAAALGALSPETLARFDAQLARPVAIEPGDARAIVALEGATIVGAHAIPSVSGRVPGERAERLAQRLLGRRVAGDGTTDLPVDDPVRVLDFGWASRP